jgi:hypothetical protein
VMLMLVFWICCLLLSLFLLCILFSLSLFSRFFFFASPGFFVLSPCMLPLFFLCSALWIFVLCRSWLFFFFSSQPLSSTLFSSLFLCFIESDRW